MAKLKKTNEDIFKKLKPLELTNKNKTEKKEKLEKKEEHKKSQEEAHEINPPRNNFSDNSVWQTKEFNAPHITRSAAEAVPLEITADRAESSGRENSEANGVDYSSVPKSESAAYRISSDYEGRKSYDPGRTGELIRPAMGLGNEQRRMELTNPFVRTEGVQRSELEEFSKLEEQQRREREENEKLPFMQKKRREEIF
jgi:hypothetical protein